MRIVLKKFQKLLTKNGYLSRSEKITQQIFKLLYLKKTLKSSSIFFHALNNIKPYVLIENKKIRGSMVAIPKPLSLKIQMSRALNNLIKHSHKTKLKTKVSLAQELIDSFEKKSQTFKDSQLLHSIAIQNKSFSRPRRFKRFQKFRKYLKKNVRS